MLLTLLKGGGGGLPPTPIIGVTTETEAVSEAVSRLLGLVRGGENASVTDVQITDAAQALIGQIKSVSEYEKIDESISIVRAIVRSIDESVLVGTGKGDADDTTALAINKAISDVIGVADAALAALEQRRSVSDTIQILESAIYVNLKLMTVNDSMGISDQINRVAGFVRIIDEGFGTATVGRTTFIRRR